MVGLQEWEAGPDLTPKELSELHLTQAFVANCLPPDSIFFPVLKRGMFEPSIRAASDNA